MHPENFRKDWAKGKNQKNKKQLLCVARADITFVAGGLLLRSDGYIARSHDTTLIFYVFILAFQFSCSFFFKFYFLFSSISCHGFKSWCILFIKTTSIVFQKTRMRMLLYQHLRYLFISVLLNYSIYTLAQQQKSLKDLPACAVPCADDALSSASCVR